MVKDINSGSGAEQSPHHLTAVGNTLYFSAYDGTNGSELWKSDGTASGTVMVKDINNGSGGSFPIPNSQPLATPSISQPTTEPTDMNCGRAMEQPGTVMVRDLLRGSGSSNPLEFTAVSDILYFKADGAWYSYARSMATSYEGYFDCLIVADSDEWFGVEFAPYGSDSSLYPIQWSVSTKVEQAYPLEDPQRGDSEAFAALPPLLQHNDTTTGVYNFYFDQDDYSIAIDHGTMQHLMVTTDTPTEIRFYHNACGREGEGTFSSMGYSQNVQLDTSVSSHTFWVRHAFHTR